MTSANRPVISGAVVSLGLVGLVSPIFEWAAIPAILAVLIGSVSIIGSVWRSKRQTVTGTFLGVLGLALFVYTSLFYHSENPIQERDARMQARALGNIYSAAKKCAAEHQGSLPKDVEELRQAGYLDVKSLEQKEYVIVSSGALAACRPYQLLAVPAIRGKAMVVVQCNGDIVRMDAVNWAAQDTGTVNYY